MPRAWIIEKSHNVLKLKSFRKLSGFIPFFDKRTTWKNHTTSKWHFQPKLENSSLPLLTEPPREKVIFLGKKCEFLFRSSFFLLIVLGQKRDMCRIFQKRIRSIGKLFFKFVAFSLNASTKRRQIQENKFNLWNSDQILMSILVLHENLFFQSCNINEIICNADVILETFSVKNATFWTLFSIAAFHEPFSHIVLTLGSKKVFLYLTSHLSFSAAFDPKPWNWFQNDLGKRSQHNDLGGGQS